MAPAPIWPIINPDISLPMFPLRDEEVDAAHSWFAGILHAPMLPRP
jgi:hypothetical protein